LAAGVDRRGEQGDEAQRALAREPPAREQEQLPRELLVAARAQPALHQPPRQRRAEPVERRARLRGRLVDVLEGEQLRGAHRVAGLEAVRGGDEEDHPALDPDERGEVGGRRHPAADAERGALERRQARVLAAGEPGRARARPVELDPAGRRRGEALGGGEREQLRGALGAGAQPLPQPRRHRLHALGAERAVGGVHRRRLAPEGAGYPSGMATTVPSDGILSKDRAGDREAIIKLLEKAYWMEIETVMSYMANSINPDGVRAQEVIESLEEDIQEELGHARQFGERIKELYGVVPGSLEFTAEQHYLQPPERQTDIVHVIRGVIEAETKAIDLYNQIIEFCDDKDLVTQDMVIDILRDEEQHRRLFEGFLREYEAEGLA
jgi:bacterioferritin